MQIKTLFNKPKIMSICGDVNEGKSMLLYHILETLNEDKKFKLFTYGLRLYFPKSRQIYSVREIETIKDSLIIVDELSSLFDLDNRKIKKQIENTLRLINHNNNILVLCGTPENFKKFLSAKLDIMMFKKITLADLINGSRLKNIIMTYKGNERGAEVLNLALNKAIVYDGYHYDIIDIPYYAKYDTKSDNEKILKPKK